MSELMYEKHWAWCSADSVLHKQHPQSPQLLWTVGATAGRTRHVTVGAATRTGSRHAHHLGVVRRRILELMTDTRFLSGLWILFIESIPMFQD